jgi:hypothetical protein
MQRPVISLTTTELAERLFNLGGRATPVTFVAHTIPEMRKGKVPNLNPYIGRVIKIARVNGIIGWRYERTVNRQRVREGKPDNFEASQRKWGERLPNSPLVVYNGVYYLEVKCERILDSDLLLDGMEPGDEQYVDILRWIPEPKEGGRQGLNKPVILRDYTVSNIRTLTMDGVQYVIEQ